MVTTIPSSSTQIIIGINDQSVVRDIRRLLSRVQGVSSIQVKNNYYESREFYEDLDAAEQDIANGKGKLITSKKELDALFV